VPDITFNVFTTLNAAESIVPLPTFPENFRQICSDVLAQSCSQTAKQRRKHSLLGGGKTLKTLKNLPVINSTARWWAKLHKFLSNET